MSRLFALAPCALSLFALLINPYLSSDDAFYAAIKVISGYGAILFAPGLAIILILDHRSQPAFERLGLAVAVSFVIIQALCVSAITLHLPTTDVTRWLLTATLLAGLVSLLRPGLRNETRPAPPAALVTFGIIASALIAVPLYLEGGIAAAAWHPSLPVLNWEDTLHIGLARRLASVAAPGFTNLSLYPEMPITYPFPGTHYLYALVAHAAALPDVLFVYDKARVAFWLAALSCYWVLTLAMSGRRETADLVPLVFSIAVLTGSLARWPMYFIGQVAPLSHPAEVAGELWLPLLVMTSVRFVEKGLGRKALYLYGLTSLGLCLSLICVHPREVVQYLVYTSMLVVSMVVIGFPRIRIALLLGQILVLASALVGYVQWHTATVPSISTIVEDGRSEFLAYVAALPWWRFIFPLDPAHQYVYAFDTATVTGLNGALLLALPVIVWRYRMRAPMVMAGLSALGYLLVCGIGALSIVVILLTNDEMLMVPVRNWHIFLRVVLIIGLFELGVALREARMSAIVAVAVVVGLATLGARSFAGPRYGVILIPATLALATVCGRIILRCRHPNSETLEPRSGWERPALVVSLGVIAGAFTPTYGPMGNWRWWWQDATPGGRAMHLFDGERQAIQDWRGDHGLAAVGGCLEGKATGTNIYLPGASLPFIRQCYPPAELLSWARRNIGDNAVLAVNVFNSFSPQPFLDVQLAAPPFLRRHGLGIRDARTSLPRAAAEFDRLPNGADQPIFNAIQEEADIHGSIERMMVTHILLDPMHAELRPRFASMSWLHEVWHEGEWSIFQINRPEPT